jgi:DNA-binding transcriptional LysR family regulator
VINLNQLRVFYHVAKNLSFTQAARELFITQPAVTAQIKLFEEWCDLKFFKKKGRGICLTAEGESLYAYARKIFEYEKDIENVIDDLRNLKKGVLRIGTTKTYARFLMPFLMKHFHDKYPQISIELNEGSSLEMINSLIELKNDIGIITQVMDHPDIEFTPFSEEELIPIFNPRHPLAKAPSVSVEQLAAEPIIMRERGSGTRKYVNALFERHHCTPNILMETSNSEFIKHLVERGDGISFLVEVSVIKDIQEKRLVTVPIADERVYLDASIFYLKSQPLSLAARAFLETLDSLALGGRPFKGILSFLQYPSKKG